MITAIQCKHCLNIIYSRANHDMRWCDCKRVAIDGGFDYKRICGEVEDINFLGLDERKLLEFILHCDWNYHNTNSDLYPKGYHGKFEIVPSSSKKFYDELIVEGKVIYGNK